MNAWSKFCSGLNNKSEPVKNGIHAIYAHKWVMAFRSNLNIWNATSKTVNATPQEVMPATSEEVSIVHNFSQ